MTREADITAAVAAITATRSFRAAEKQLGYVALCMIGPHKPVLDWTGGNSLRWPVALRTHKEPAKAAARTNSEHWEGSKSAPHVVTLRYVWTPSEIHAGRLKEALYEQLLGKDPEMRRLNGSWVDLPEWEIVWDILLQDALGEIRAGRETIDVFDETDRVQRVLRHSRGKVLRR